MADLLLVVVCIAFTALCAAYVAWCDRIVGPDPVAPGDDLPAAEPAREPVGR